MMLHPGNDNLIIFLNVASTPTLRHQVNAFGCPAHKDNLARCSGIEKAARLFAGRLVSIGRARRQLVRSTMYVEVFVFIKVTQAVNDRLRLLPSRAVIEPDQRMPIDLLLQNRKIATNCLYIKGG